MIRAIARCLAASMLALFLMLPAHADAAGPDAKPYSYLSAASNNATLVYAGTSLVKWVLVVNTTATTYYLKLYSKASAPTCGTDTPALRIPVPPQADGGVVALSLENSQFALGVGFCLVAGIADNDNTNAATGVAVNLGVAWQ